VALIVTGTLATAAVSLAAPADEDAAARATEDDSALPGYTPNVDGGVGSAGGGATPDQGGGTEGEWDPAVADLARWVEDFRGLSFDHAVPVDFLTPEEFTAEVEAAPAADAGSLDAEVAHLRGFGLLPGGVDLAAAEGDLADVGTLAYYDVMGDRIVVRGTDMTPGVQGTVVHELTHALQAQHFTLLPGETPEADMAQLAVVEGDAMRAEAEWTFSLDGDELDAYRAEAWASYEEGDAALADVPSILQALAAGPYTLGPQLVDVLAADGGNAAVDAALADPPRSTEQALDPQAFLAGDEPITVEAPALPPTATGAGDGVTLGAFELYLVLAARLGPVQALDAVDGWAGDSLVTYQEGERACVAVAVQGDSDSDAEQLQVALDDWAAAGPADTARVAPGPGDATTLLSCEPVAGAAPQATAGSTDALDALLLLDSRAFFTWEAMELEGAGVDDAMARSNCLVRALPLDTLAALYAGGEPPPAAQEALDGAKASCTPG
jgi:hypothetical protein